MLRYFIFVHASTCTWCYATWTSLALLHELDATLLELHWRFYMHLMLRYLNFTGTSTWTWCYATWTSLALLHELDATLLDHHWHFYMNLMLRYLIFLYASMWTWCYVTWSSSTLLHELDATLLVFALKPGLGQCVGCLCILHARDVGSIKSKENVWELGLAEAGRALRTKMQKFADANPCQGLSGLHGQPIFSKNRSQKFKSEDACIWTRTCSHVDHWQSQLDKIYTQLQRERNFPENNDKVMQKHDMGYQQRYMWRKPLQLGQTSPVNPIYCCTTCTSQDPSIPFKEFVLDLGIYIERRMKSNQKEVHRKWREVQLKAEDSFLACFRVYVLTLPPSDEHLDYLGWSAPDE